MDGAADERRYAWRMVRAARRAGADGAETLARDVTALLDQALDAGLDRTELVVALADLGGRFLALCEPSVSGSAEDVCA